MIKKITLLTPLVAFLIFGLNMDYGHTYPTQPPPSNAGAPNMSTCSNTGCHASNPLNEPGGMASIVLTGADSTYVPGNTYNVTINVSKDGTSRYGFQMVALNGDGESIGSFLAPDPNIGLNTTNGIDYVQHKDIAPTNEGEFSFQWNAPAIGGGTVNFYSSVIAANGADGPMGDFVYTTSLSLEEEIDWSDPANWLTGVEELGNPNINVYPNPVRDQLNIEGTEDMKSVLLFDSKGNLLENHRSVNKLALGGKYPGGVYFLKIVEAEQITTKRILVL